MPGSHLHHTEQQWNKSASFLHRLVTKPLSKYVLNPLYNTTIRPAARATVGKWVMPKVLNAMDTPLGRRTMAIADHPFTRGVASTTKTWTPRILVGSWLGGKAGDYLTDPNRTAASYQADGSILRNGALLGGKLLWNHAKPAARLILDSDYRNNARNLVRELSAELNSPDVEKLKQEVKKLNPLNVASQFLDPGVKATYKKIDSALQSGRNAADRDNYAHNWWTNLKAFQRGLLGITPKGVQDRVLADPALSNTMILDEPWDIRPQDINPTLSNTMILDEPWDIRPQDINPTQLYANPGDKDQQVLPGLTQTDQDRLRLAMNIQNIRGKYNKATEKYDKIIDDINEGYNGLTGSDAKTRVDFLNRQLNLHPGIANTMGGQKLRAWNTEANQQNMIGARKNIETEAKMFANGDATLRKKMLDAKLGNGAIGQALGEYNTVENQQKLIDAQQQATDYQNSDQYQQDKQDIKDLYHKATDMKRNYDRIHNLISGTGNTSITL